ncbi:MAG: class I SAM-dependent methyltransferase [Myxococcales bacterium]|nr:class I SAM-dependent methyltransferase [Myxococcales bacterium]
MRAADTRRSWDVATAHHNAHKGDQAALLRGGGDTLFDEELGLLGELAGRRLVHLQCNSGQDSLCLARRGAEVTGVDFSPVAIDFARGLSEASGIPARFELAEVVGWMAATDARFDLAFASYGVTGWLEDLGAWARGVARILRPGGRFVYVEFHPLVWSVDAEFRISRDDYFAREPFLEPVGDYVAASGPGLGAPEGATPGVNEVPAVSWQHTLGAIVSALAGAGLVLEVLREYPYSNGCRVIPGLVDDGAGDRRWRHPPGQPQVPLMFGVSFVRP